MDDFLRRPQAAQLASLHSEVVRVAALVAEAVPRGTEALLGGDLAEAERTIADDDAIDELTIDIEDHCHHLLARHVVAGELRSVVAALKLAAELERTGDLVVNICKAARRLYGVPLSPRLRGLIERMSRQAQQLLLHAIDAYDEHDAGLAAALHDMDDHLDDLHAEFIRAIFEAHAAQGLDLQVAVQLAVVGRFYERIGDHAVNVGERVSYMVTGRRAAGRGERRQAAVRPAAG